MKQSNWDSNSESKPGRSILIRLGFSPILFRTPLSKFIRIQQSGSWPVPCDCLWSIRYNLKEILIQNSVRNCNGYAATVSHDDLTLLYGSEQTVVPPLQIGAHVGLEITNPGLQSLSILKSIELHSEWALDLRLSKNLKFKFSSTSLYQ